MRKTISKEAKKLTLTTVVRKTTDKYRRPLVSAKGRPYTKLLLKAVEYGDQWISGFAAEWNSMWKEGDVVDTIVEEQDVNGIVYLGVSKGAETQTGSVPTVNTDALATDHIRMEKKLDMILEILNHPAPDQGVPEERPSIDAIPFDYRDPVSEPAEETDSIPF